MPENFKILLLLGFCAAPALAASASLESQTEALQQSTDAVRAANILFENDARSGATAAPASAPGAARVAAGASGAGELAAGASASDAAQSRYLRQADSGSVPGVGKRPDALTASLSAQDLQSRGYTALNIADLENGITGVCASVRALHERSPSWVADETGSGVLTNAVQALDAPFSTRPYSRGSQAHQRAELGGAPQDSSMEYAPVVTGEVVERHAVVAFPRPPRDVAGDPARLAAWWKEKGVVLDGWARQSADPDKLVYPTVKDWQSLTLFSLWSGPRLEAP